MRVALLQYASRAESEALHSGEVERCVHVVDGELSCLFLTCGSTITEK